MDSKRDSILLNMNFDIKSLHDLFIGPKNELIHFQNMSLFYLLKEVRIYNNLVQSRFLGLCCLYLSVSLIKSKENSLFVCVFVSL